MILDQALEDEVCKFAGHAYSALYVMFGKLLTDGFNEGLGADEAGHAVAAATVVAYVDFLKNAGATDEDLRQHLETAIARWNATESV